jgi:hypothetical protein
MEQIFDAVIVGAGQATRLSCDHRRRLNRARASEAASGVTVTTEPTPFILTNSRYLEQVVPVPQTGLCRLVDGLAMI